MKSHDKILLMVVVVPDPPIFIGLPKPVAFILRVEVDKIVFRLTAPFSVTGIVAEPIVVEPDVFVVPISVFNPVIVTFPATEPIANVVSLVIDGVDMPALNVSNAVAVSENVFRKYKLLA
jgi:hypothetical protein